MTTVLVTGGAGFIATHTDIELLNKGYDVISVDNYGNSSPVALERVEQITGKPVKRYDGDVRDEALMERVFAENNIDWVIHFAGLKAVGESVAKPIEYYDNNLYGTKVLLEAMVRNGVDKIVFSSTAATYGEPERVPILESDPTVPTNCYGNTKLSMEQMMSWVSKAHGLRYVALRYFNACGAHISGKIGEAHNPETHLIPIILQVPLGQREAVSMFGDDYPTKDGTCIRDYIHVTDLAQAHILALDYLLEGGENNVFNLGNGVGFTVKEVVDVARQVTGHPTPAQGAPRRAGDPAQLIASSQKAVDVLGWKPKYNDLNTIVATAWAWHKNHPNGFEEG